MSENERLRIELDAADRTLRQLSDTLTRIAAALKGEPPEFTAHSWHDLPEIAAENVEYIRHMEAIVHGRDEETQQLRRQRDALRDAARQISALALCAIEESADGTELETR